MSKRAQLRAREKQRQQEAAAEIRAKNSQLYPNCKNITGNGINTAIMEPTLGIKLRKKVSTANRSANWTLKLANIIQITIAVKREIIHLTVIYRVIWCFISLSRRTPDLGDDWFPTIKKKVKISTSNKLPTIPTILPEIVLNQVKIGSSRSACLIIVKSIFKPNFSMKPENKSNNLINWCWYTSPLLINPLRDIPINKIRSPIPRNKTMKVKNIEIGLGHLKLLLNILTKGSVRKNNMSENTKGTSTVFIKNRAVIIPRTHIMTNDVGTIDDFIWFIFY